MVDLHIGTRKGLSDLEETFDDNDNYNKVLRFGDDKLESEIRGYIANINERNENARATAIYNDAISKMGNANSEEAFKAVASTFESISSFKDSAELKELCLEKAEECRKDDIYTKAQDKASGKTIKDYETAIELFETIPNWKDSNEQIEKCREKIDEIRAKQEADEISAKKRKKITKILMSIVLIIVTFVTVMETVVIKNNKYNAAMELIDSKDYESAYLLLDGLSYKDSEAKFLEIKPSYYRELLLNADIGSTVFFGYYEQDNNISNGKEDIEWQVLDKEDDKILVISKYALDCQQYNSTNTDITWEDSKLRKWLNERFANEAFSTSEVSQINMTNVVADKNPEYNTNPGNDTIDKVFLLSIDEVEEYFISNEDRICVPTKYAIAQGAWTSYGYTKDGKDTCYWWLRSPGNYQDCAAIVTYDGSVNCDGLLVDYVYTGVRPALWINLES